MRETPIYNEYLPKWYYKRVSTYWWLWRWPFLKFILRELSSVPIAYFVVLTLFQLQALRQGPVTYAEFQAWLSTPLALALNGLALFFVLFHTITWFNLAPRAIVLRWRGKRVPDLLVTAGNYVAWLVVSAGVVWYILGG